MNPLVNIATYVVLLNNLLEPSVVQLGEFGEIVDVGNDIAENLFELQEILVVGRGHTNAIPAIASGALEARHDITDFELTSLDALDNLLTLPLLESKDLLQLALEQSDEILLVILGPFATRGFGVFGGRRSHVIGLETFLQLVVGDIEGVVVPDHGRAEVFTEPEVIGRRSSVSCGEAFLATMGGIDREGRSSSRNAGTHLMLGGCY